MIASIETWMENRKKTQAQHRCREIDRTEKKNTAAFLSIKNQTKHIWDSSIQHIHDSNEYLFDIHYFPRVI